MYNFDHSKQATDGTNKGSDQDVQKDQPSQSQHAELMQKDSSPNAHTQTYTQKDLDDASRFAKEAEKLLGKLEIDGLPGISRSEIISAEGKKTISPEHTKVLAGLNNMEPNVQDAWQVPNHRAHLQKSNDVDFYLNAAKLLRKAGDEGWAKELEGEAARERPATTKQLAQDSKDQADVYFHRGDVNKAQLEELQQEIGRVHVAVKILGNVDGAAAELYKKIHTPNAVLTQSDKMLIAAVDGSKLNVKDLTGALKDWAVGETRTDGRNQEKLFYRAIEGYHGNGLEIKTPQRFAREMNSKDQSQLNDDERANNGRHVPHFSAKN